MKEIELCMKNKQKQKKSMKVVKESLREEKKKTIRYWDMKRERKEFEGLKKQQKRKQEKGSRGRIKRKG